MDKVTEFPNTTQVRNEAENWIIRLDGADKITEKNRAELKAWLDKSPAHRKELVAANKFWQNQVLTELMVPLTDSVRPRRTKAFRAFSVSAAAAVLVLGVVFLLQYSFNKNTNGLYVTAVGQQQSITLGDGSMVELNTNSQIDVEYTRNARNVYLLQGEAHFSVAKNPDKPFRVYAANSRVQAVGTAFSVKLLRDSLDILVTEGRVGLAALSRKPRKNQDQPGKTNEQGSQDIELPLGTLDAFESLTLTETTAKGDIRKAITHVSNEELTRRTSWREGLLVFNGETLEEVVEEISRYTTLSIEIPDPDTRKIQVGGRFQLSDMEALFSALETNFDLRAEYTDYNHIQLTQRY